MYEAQQTVMRDTEEFRNSCEGKYTRGEGHSQSAGAGPLNCAPQQGSGFSGEGLRFE